jgi:uroporphyrin-III C-methyltransferase
VTFDRAMDRMGYRPPLLDRGHVCLAGAGPGDPGCLTLDVVSALAQADAVVYDALVQPSVLAIAEKAEPIFAGKRGGRPSMRQDDITDLLIRLAREGRRVLRLKGGDPYVFGRGGEEALALAQANVPFRILPGVTSAFGALAAAGIPATMRGISKAITLATGHGAGTEDDLDWAALARAGQPIVVYMGLKNLALIAAALIEGGLAADTPAAVLESATTPQERIVVATLDRIAAEAEAAGIQSPALIAIGRIVSMRAALAGPR